MPVPNGVGIVKFVRRGELTADVASLDDLYNEASTLMDRACTHDIVGEVIFEGSDGKYYVASIELDVSEANPEYVQEVLLDADEDNAETEEDGTKED